MALTDSLSTITAYANDVSYDAIFSETLKNFARPGDLLIAISGSGNSPNVLLAADAAHAAGCRTITLTGRDGGRLAARAKLNILAPDRHMGRIEDVHMIVCHMIAYSFMELEGAAARQLTAKDEVTRVSRSFGSGTGFCIRKAISYCSIRAAVSDRRIHQRKCG